jgi:uncharacterized membrane protein YkoI
MTRHNSQFTTQTEDDSRRDAEAQRKERKTQEKGKQGFCAPAEDKEKQEVSRDRGGPKYRTEDDSRRDAGTQGKASTKEWVSRNGATHAKGGKERKGKFDKTYAMTYF